MKYFVSSIYAGIMIAFGGAVYMSLPYNKYVGAFLFSLGLLTVVLREFDLYTGKIGYITLTKKGSDNSLLNIRKNPSYFPAIIAGNFIGAWLIGMLMRSTRHADIIISETNAAVAAKLSDTPLSIFLLSAACGVMMFLAVDGYKKSKNWLFVILPVMVFILCGFEHSIANMFYISAAGQWSPKAFAYVAIMVLGNGFGAAAFRFFEKFKKTSSDISQ